MVFFPKLLDAPGRSARQQKRADGNQQKQRHAYDQARLLHRIGSSSVCAFFEHSIRPPRERYRGPDFRVPNPNKRPAPYSFQFPAASCESNRRVIAFGAARGTNLSGCAEMRAVALPSHGGLRFALDKIIGQTALGFRSDFINRRPSFQGIQRSQRGLVQTLMCAGRGGRGQRREIELIQTVD